MHKLHHNIILHLKSGQHRDIFVVTDGGIIRACDIKSKCEGMRRQQKTMIPL